MIEMARRGEPTEQHADALRAQQDEVRRILDMTEHLDPADRTLIRSLYDRGITAAELARATGMHPETVRRRARRLMRRMAEQMYRYVLQHKRNWPKPRKDVAIHIFLRGAGQRETAAALGMSLHDVRQHAHSVQATFEQTVAEEKADRTVAQRAQRKVSR